MYTEYPGCDVFIVSTRYDKLSGFFSGYRVQNSQQGVGVFVQAWISLPVPEQYLSAVVSFQTLSIPKIANIRDLFVVFNSIL